LCKVAGALCKVAGGLCKVGDAWCKKEYLEFTEKLNMGSN